MGDGGSRNLASGEDSETDGTSSTGPLESGGLALSDRGRSVDGGLGSSGGGEDEGTGGGGGSDLDHFVGYEGVD